MHYKIQPWSHQLHAIELAKNRDCFALFLDTGCGKTSTLINILRHNNGAVDTWAPTLILCPQIVIENWKRELLAHSFLVDKDIVCLRDSEKKRLAAFVGGWQDGARIFVTNYEALLMGGLTALFHKTHFDTIVLDESHKCKQMSAKRTKEVLKLGASAKHRYILSGTPVVNSVFDIFSQFLFLDNGATFGKKFTSFRAEYFYDKNSHMPRHCYFPNWEIRTGALEEINKRIYRSAMRVTKAECLDLPPFVRQIVEVEMTQSQSKLYKEIARDAVSYAMGGVISADMAIKKALRLQQIVTGHVTNDDKIVVHLEHNRIKALKEVIETLPKEAKFIIWAVFKHNYAEIRALLQEMEIGYGEVHGEVSAHQQQFAIGAFSVRSSVSRCLLAHPASGGTGINLVAASYSIFYSRGFSLENDLQAEARNYRGGSEVHEKITRIDLVTSGTTDDIILTALQNKKNVSEAVLEYLKK